MLEDAKDQNSTKKESITDMVNKFNTNKEPDVENVSEVKATTLPTAALNSNNFKTQQYNEMMNKETDPDLMIVHEIIPLPSKGVFYANGVSELQVEYMTSKDEDLITTPSLIESGKVLNMLLKRKIKTPGINPEDLLAGDRNAILLYLRTSSYGYDYDVEVIDPRNGIPFKSVVDLSKLQYKELVAKPDQNGCFEVFLPMRKKNVMIKLLTSGDDVHIFDKAEEIKKAYNKDFSEYNTMKIKASIVSIGGNADRSYIDRFVDAMPARDSLFIRKKLLEIHPDVDMAYEFVANDGFKFTTHLTVGIDFFFPSN